MKTRTAIMFGVVAFPLVALAAGYQLVSSTEPAAFAPIIMAGFSNDSATAIGAIIQNKVVLSTAGSRLLSVRTGSGLGTEVFGFGPGGLVYGPMLHGGNISPATDGGSACGTDALRWSMSAAWRWSTVEQSVEAADALVIYPHRGDQVYVIVKDRAISTFDINSDGALMGEPVTVIFDQLGPGGVGYGSPASQVHVAANAMPVPCGAGRQDAISFRWSPALRAWVETGRARNLGRAP